MHGPRGVAEVAAQFPAHGDCGERLELHAVVGVEPLRRLEYGDAGDLDEVLERLATGAVRTGDRDSQPVVLLDDIVAQRAVTALAIPTQGSLRGHVEMSTNVHRGPAYPVMFEPFGRLASSPDRVTPPLSER